jgi:hypothetical protein
MAGNIDARTAIRNGDANELRRVLMQESARANALIHWGDNDRIRTHPLHYISDMLFEGALKKGKELPLVDALIEAGADVDFHLNEEKRETPLIGAASLGAEDVGLRLLTAGAAPHLRGMFGETALHWAALLGEDRLVGGLIAGADLTLKDERYNASPLGWAIHGWCNPPAGNHGRQREVVELLVAAGAGVKSEWLLSEKVRADPAMLAALRGGST